MNDTSNVPQLNSHTQSSAATATGAPGAPFPEAPASAPGGPLDSFRMSPEGRRRVNGIRDIEVTDSGVIVTCITETRRTEHGYTHETPLNFNNPAEGDTAPLYIHIQLWTDSIFRIVFSGEKTVRDPYAGLPAEARMLVGAPGDVDFTFEDNVIRTKEISIRIDPDTGRISAARNGGGEFFSQRKSEFNIADVYDLSLSKDGEYTACFEALELDNDELIYGLGERFDSLTRNGRAVDFHNKDCLGTATPRTYINIPFYMSTRGYGLFLNSAARTDWQIGTLSAGSLQFGVWDGQLDYFVIAGRTPKDILKGYCYLTGYAKLPPLWSFGLWMSRNSYTSWDVAEQIAREI
ncbi:MAG: hypothetical protein J5758_04240, partial [Abditibacteriota bacterium]|nr:hypothetical protein [Abditibacteriota bacterium]